MDNASNPPVPDPTFDNPVHVRAGNICRNHGHPWPCTPVRYSPVDGAPVPDFDREHLIRTLTETRAQLHDAQAELRRLKAESDCEVHTAQIAWRDHTIAELKASDRTLAAWADRMEAERDEARAEVARLRRVALDAEVAWAAEHDKARELVIALARCTGTPETTIRLNYGLNQAGESA